MGGTAVPATDYALTCGRCGMALPPTAQMCVRCKEPLPRAERKWVTALCIDLSHYTTLVDQVDPELAHRRVSAVLAAAHSAVSQHGGLVHSTAGDGFLALFGVPSSTGDDAVRALLAAEAMHRWTAQQPAWEGLGVPPALHIGAASGEVLVRNADAVGLSVVGSAINLASRLCSAASPGQTLTDERTRHLATGRSRFRPRPAAEIRGFQTPVATFEVIEVTGPVAIVSSAALPFLNRTAELAALQEAASVCAVRGSSAVLQVAADPGIGKTRLVDHWLASRAGLPVLALSATHGPTSRSGPS